jgi:hypothetical protein
VGPLWGVARALAHAEQAHDAALRKYADAVDARYAAERRESPCIGYLTPLGREGASRALALLGREVVAEHFPQLRFRIAPTEEGRAAIEKAKVEELRSGAAASNAAQDLERARIALREAGIAAGLVTPDVLDAAPAAATSETVHAMTPSLPVLAA